MALAEESEKTAEVVRAAVIEHIAAGRLEEATHEVEQLSARFRGSGVKDCRGEAIALATTAEVHLAKQRPKDAQQLATQALALVPAGAGRQGDQRARAATLHALAEVHLVLQKPERALPMVEEELALLRVLRDDTALDEAKALQTLCKTHCQKQEPQEAIRAARRALRLSEGFGDLKMESRAWNVVASAHLAQKPKGQEDALKAAMRAVELSKEVGDSRTEFDAWTIVATGHCNQKKNDEALEALSHAITLATSMADADKIGSTLDLIMEIDPNKANDLVQEELRSSRRLKDAKREAIALQRLAATQLLLEKPEEATRRAREAVSLQRKKGSAKGESAALQQLADIYLATQQHDEALKTARQMEALNRDGEDIMQVVQALQLVVTVLLQMEKPEEALRASFEQRETYKKAGYKDEEAAALLGVADLLFELNWPKEAVKAAQEARMLYQAMADGNCEGSALIQIATLQLQSGCEADALNSASEAQSLFERLGDASGHSKALHVTCSVYLAQDKREDAQRTAREARDICMKAGDLWAEALSLHVIANVYSDAVKKEQQRETETGEAPDPRNAQQMLVAATELLRIARDLEDASLTATGLQHLANAELALGNSVDAAEHAQEALSQFEQLDDVESQKNTKEIIAEARHHLVDEGDLVELINDGKLVRGACKSMGCTWKPLMMRMLGKTYRVLEIQEQRGILGLPALDKSDGGDVWYFPINVVRKAPYIVLQGTTRRIRDSVVRNTLAQMSGKEPFECVSDDLCKVRPADLSSPIAALGECGDPLCGAHRLNQPNVRARFRKFIVRTLRRALRTNTQWWDDGIRYASLGCGQLLFDAELIEQLRGVGVRFSQICIIDSAYKEEEEATQKALDAFADWHRAAARLCNDTTPQILAFGSTRDYRDCTGDNAVASGCHLFVHCDAYWEGVEEECQELVLQALAPGGLFVRLSNLGSAEKITKEMTEKGPEAQREFMKVAKDHADGPFAAGAWTFTGADLEQIADPLLGEDIEQKLDRQNQAASRLTAEKEQRAKQNGYELWEVIHEPHVILRSTPSTEADSLGFAMPGEQLVGIERKGEWLRIATNSELWGSEYSETATDNDVNDQPRWVLIEGASLGLGLLLKQTYIPPGREPYCSVAGRKARRRVVVREGDVIALATHHCGGSEEAWLTCKGGQKAAQLPAAARRRQRDRMRWRALYAELHELPDSARRARRNELTHKEKADLASWWPRECSRWLAFVAELQDLPAPERRRRLEGLSVEERTCLYAAKEERRLSRAHVKALGANCAQSC